MVWLDGSFDVEQAELEEKFPVAITDCVRMNDACTEMALINDFPLSGIIITRTIATISI